MKNNIKLAVRKLEKEKLLSFIVIFGLAVSLLVCLLIGLFVSEEMSYDDFQSNKDRILLFQQWEKSAGSGSGFADMFRRNLSGAEEVTRVIKTEPLITSSDKSTSFYEKNFCFAEANFSKVFDLHFTEGSRATAFGASGFLLISKSAAIKYFGTKQAVGKMLFYNKTKPFYITGVFADMPRNSHIAIDFLCDYKSAKTLIGQELDGYWDGLSLTYILLSKGTTSAIISHQLPQLIGNLHDQNAAIWKPRFIPLKDIYLHEKMDDRVKAINAISDVYVFSAIAFCIILLAAFNYVNMVTASAVSHLKSVSVRRLLGAQRKQLIGQYLIESFVYVLLSATIAWLAAFGGVAAFNSLAQTSLSAEVLYSSDVLMLYFGSVIPFAVINGLYPAYFLSSFKPLQAIRQRFFTSHDNYSLRKALVVFQFTVSVVMIIAVIVVSSQLQYIRNQNLGYDRNSVLTFTFPSDASLLQKQTFLNGLGDLARVRSVTLGSRLPGEGAFGNKLVESYAPEGKDLAYQNFSVDQNFLSVFGIHLQQGRNFSTTDKADQHYFIINQTMCNLLHFGNDAPGKPLAYYTYQYSENGSYKEVPVKGEIIGVIDDYHQSDLRTAIQPLLLQYNAGWEGEAAVKLDVSDMNQTMVMISSRWKRSFPAVPFQYRFLDDVFNQAYQKDAVIGSALNVFSALAILISCLGLLGLTAITVQQKVKEIGIRKVLGASVIGIVLLVARNYIWLMAVALLLAIPVAWYAMHQWLQSFAYRTDMNWLMFAAGGIGAVAVALLAVSFQAIKAARTNPVKNLRTE